MSPREQLQNELVDWLEAYPARFTAPYGILPSLDNIKNGKGKVRTITFGVARYLDATIYIWSTDRITVQAAGPLAYKIDGSTFKNAEELKQVLATL